MGRQRGRAGSGRHRDTSRRWDGIFGETAAGSMVTTAEVHGGCKLRRRMGGGTEETAGVV